MGLRRRATDEGVRDVMMGASPSRSLCGLHDRTARNAGSERFLASGPLIAWGMKKKVGPFSEEGRHEDGQIWGYETFIVPLFELRDRFVRSLSQG